MRQIFRSPLTAALVTLVPGILGLISGQLLLFPSLAPSAVLQAHDPHAPSSRPYNVVVSHLVGMVTAYLMVWFFDLSHSPSVFTVGHLSPARVAAAVLAVLLGTLFEVLLRATHAPAASTTLLVALGSFSPSWHSATVITAGVLATAAAGEVGRQLQPSRRG
jgi:HPP family